MSLAVSPDGKHVASASWDRTVRIWSAEGGDTRVLEGHQQNVNAVAFSPDGKSLVSVSYDPQLRIWPLDGGAPTIVTIASPLNSVAVARDGEIVVGGGRWKSAVLFGDRRGKGRSGGDRVTGHQRRGFGRRQARRRRGIRGSVGIIDRASRKLERTLVGPGLPVWAAAFMPDSRTLVTGGTDRMVRRWDAVSGDHIGMVALAATEDPLAVHAGDRGAEVYRACVACHTLTRTKAIARVRPCTASSAAGSPRCRATTFPTRSRSSISSGHRRPCPNSLKSARWNIRPGTKMPEQQIGSAEDRAALVEFLKKTTTK